MLTALLFVGSCSISNDDPSPQPEEHVLREAAWVFADVFGPPENRDALIRAAAEGGFNTIYLSVYQPVVNARGHRMYDDDAVADVIRRARSAGIEVWAVYGNDDWPLLGARPGSFPHERITEVEAFNRAHPDAPFDGVILDVEPTEPVDLESLLTFYRESLKAIHAHGLNGAVAVRYFWTAPVQDPSIRAVRAAHEAVIDLTFDHVVVMGYRNFAGRPCEDNGLICLSEDHVLYAHRSDRKRHIVIGLRTSSTEVDAGKPVETFHGLPQLYMDAEKRRVVEYFSRYTGFGGFATHRLDIQPFLETQADSTSVRQTASASFGG